jgi:hypothetical protein
MSEKVRSKCQQRWMANCVRSMLLEERRQSQSCQNILSLSLSPSLAQKPLVEEFERFLGEVGLLQQIF